MKCPGQDMKYWKDDAIFDVECPNCKAEVEFYKDDTSRKCHNCGHRFVNPKLDFGCASYCQFAEQCLGTLPEDFSGAREDLLKDKVAIEVKRFFHTDFKAIRQATTTARYAEEIGKAEGGNLAVILCAAYLHGIVKEDAQDILRKAGASEPLIDEICATIETGITADPDTSLPKKIIHDALTIRHLVEQLKDNLLEKERAHHGIAQDLYTESAKAIAEELVV